MKPIQLSFFSKDPVKGRSFPNTSKIVASTYSESHAFLASSSGLVQEFLLEDFSFKAEFNAFNSQINFIRFISPNYLLVIGQDVDQIPCVKIFNYKPNEPTKLLSQQAIRKHFPITAYSFSSDTLNLLIGLENGLVYSLRFEKDKLSLPKIVIELNSSISTLAFIPNSNSSSNKELKFFVVTLSQITIMDLNSKNVRILDDIGAELNCACINNDGEMVIARKNGITFYSSQGTCLTIPHLSSNQLSLFNSSFLMLLSSDGSSHLDSQEMNPHLDKITIYDSKYNIIAFTYLIENTSDFIQHVFVSGSFIYVFLNSGNNFIINPISINEKVKLLLENHLYSVAINLASNQVKLTKSDTKAIKTNIKKTNQSINHLLMEVYKSYADHLYSKSDYSGAMDNYMLTIGHLESSYVIRRYLDTSKSSFLIDYLTKLFQKGQSTKHHISLLVSTLVKSKDSKKLYDFIDSLDPKNPQIDINACISICLESGFTEEAKKLSKKFSRYSTLMNIILLNSSHHESSDIQTYIESLSDPKELYLILKSHGHVLIKLFPETITESAIKASQLSVSCACELIPVFLGFPLLGIKFLESVISIHSVIESNQEHEEISKELVHHLFLLLVNESRFEDAMKLLSNDGIQYDPYEILVVCEHVSFKRGTEWIYESLGMYDALVDFHIVNQSHNKLSNCIRQIGKEKPYSWKKVLSYLARIVGEQTATHQNKTSKQLYELIEECDRLEILTPIQIITILSESGGINLGFLKPFLIKKIQSSNQSYEQDHLLYESYVNETTKMKQHLNDLKEKPVIFQATRCSLCQQNLASPSIHFYCKHSFHDKCVFNETCPLCSPEHDLIDDIVRNWDLAGDQYEYFIEQMEMSSGSRRFELISNWFNKGVFKNKDLQSDIN